MSAIQHRHLLTVLRSEIDKIPEAERSTGYRKDLLDHLVTVLAFERENRTKGTNIKEKVTGQVEALASSLISGTWQPGAES